MFHFFSKTWLSIGLHLAEGPPGDGRMVTMAFHLWLPRSNYSTPGGPDQGGQWFTVDKALMATQISLSQCTHYNVWQAIR